MWPEIFGSACGVLEAEGEGGKSLHENPSRGDLLLHLLLLLLLLSPGNSLLLRLLCYAALGREPTLVRGKPHGKGEGDQEVHNTHPHHIGGSGPGL